MSQEQNMDLLQWWNDKPFPAKELFKLEENGDIVLLAGNNIRERVIANVSPENISEVIANLVEKFNEVEAKVRETEVEWLAADDKMKMADKVAQVKEYLHHAAALGDFVKYALLIHDWEHTIYQLTEENYNAKLQIVTLAESLAQSDAWKETTQVFRELTEKWKQSGHIDKSRNEKLWNRIEAARKSFIDRKRLHHQDEEKDMYHNLDLKIDLVEQAEALAKSEEWKKTTEAYNRLTEEWKRIGHTFHEKNEELWQRFIAAKGVFFEHKRAHHEKIHREQEANYVIKLAIVEKAEAVKDSREWNETTQAYAAMMEEWKKTGRTFHEKGEELWKRFTEAQDVFFAAKKQHFGGIKAEQESNYQRKLALYERAEKLKNSTSWSDATKEMVDLMEEWKKVGHIPRSYGDKLWEDFNAARKYFFARKDENWERRKQYVEEQKEYRAAQAKGMVGQLEYEIKDEEAKIADFKNGLENITPGKKAAELRVHLQQLIIDCTENLKRLQAKLEKAKNDIAAPEQKKQSGSKKQMVETADEDAPQDQN